MRANAAAAKLPIPHVEPADTGGAGVPGVAGELAAGGGADALPSLVLSPPPPHAARSIAAATNEPMGAIARDVFRRFFGGQIFMAQR